MDRLDRGDARGIREEDAVTVGCRGRWVRRQLSLASHLGRPFIIETFLLFSRLGSDERPRWRQEGIEYEWKEQLEKALQEAFTFREPQPAEA